MTHSPSDSDKALNDWFTNGPRTHPTLVGSAWNAACEWQRTQDQAEIEMLRAVLKAIADPFPGKPDEWHNWPNLAKNLMDLARSYLK